MPDNVTVKMANRKKYSKIQMEYIPEGWIIWSMYLLHTLRAPDLFKEPISIFTFCVT